MIDDDELERRRVQRLIEKAQMYDDGAISREERLEKRIDFLGIHRDMLWQHIAKLERVIKVSQGSQKPIPACFVPTGGWYVTETANSCTPEAGVHADATSGAEKLRDTAPRRED